MLLVSIKLHQTKLWMTDFSFKKFIQNNFWVNYQKGVNPQKKTVWLTKDFLYVGTCKQLNPLVVLKHLAEKFEF